MSAASAIEVVASVSAGQSRRSSKDILDLLEQPAIVCPGRGLEFLRRQQLGELLEELALVARQLARRDRLHRDEQIAAPAARYVRHTLAPHAEERPRRGAFRNLQRLGASANAGHL